MSNVNQTSLMTSILSLNSYNRGYSAGPAAVAGLLVVGRKSYWVKL